MGDEAERTVAVTGATGRVGGAAARHLLADGWQVRALTRTPTGRAARALAALGAEVVRADFSDPASLRTAFAGARSVVSVQNPMASGVEAEVRHGRAVGDAAHETGIEHLVYASAGTGQPGTGVPSWESKLLVEEHLRALGLPVTVLRPMAFMELMTDRGYYPAVSTWSLMPRLMGEDRPVLWVSVDDVGAVVARVLADPARWVGTELSLVTDVRSVGQCRALHAEVTGRRPRRVRLPVPVFRRFVGEDLLVMWRWLATAELRADPVARELVPDARTVEDHLRFSARRQRATTSTS